MIDNEMRFINRTSDGKGWKVSATRSNKKFNKRFGDDIYGGVGVALVEAKNYRDSVQDEIEKESKSIFAGETPPFFKTAFRNSKSQVVGVSKMKRSILPDMWIASWQSEPMKTCTKAFAVTKYGDEGAFKLAFEARQKGIAERLHKENKMVLVK